MKSLFVLLAFTLTLRAAPVGDIFWQGTRYQDATATIHPSTGDVRLMGRIDHTSKGTIIPWEKAPLPIRSKLAAEHAAYLASLEKRKALADGFKTLRFEIQQVTPDGALVLLWQSRVVGNNRNASGGYTAVTWERGDKAIFLRGLAGAAESQQWTGVAREAGTHTFTTVLGASRTVENWTIAPGTTPARIEK